MADGNVFPSIHSRRPVNIWSNPPKKKYSGLIVARAVNKSTHGEYQMWLEAALTCQWHRYFQRLATA